MTNFTLKNPKWTPVGHFIKKTVFLLLLLHLKKKNFERTILK